MARLSALWRFLNAHGFSDAAHFLPLNGGNRHRVFRLEENQKTAVLKIYAEPLQGSRDAFRHELSLHHFLADHCRDSVPMILGSDGPSRCALFAWVDGGRLSGETIDAVSVSEMAQFIVSINQPWVRQAARLAHVPLASDAGFSFLSHLECARQRLDELLGVSIEGPSAEAMKDFVARRLAPALSEITEASRGIVGEAPTDGALSPSDFGFHNVVVRANGTFCFLDFEHAGWDDPAKLAADFILQPECVLDGELAGLFVERLGEAGFFGSDLLPRVQMLLPLQAIKWACIILNVFMFMPGHNVEMLSSRLAKAEDYWSKLDGGLNCIMPRRG